MDEFFQMAANTKLCLDTAHLAAVGGDVVKTIEDYGRRVVYAHIKDFNTNVAKPTDEEYYRGFVELGEGNIGLDFARILDAFDKHSMAEWGVIELDRARTTPLDGARKSFEHLKSIGRT